MNITIKIDAPELAQAIQSLASALSSRNGIYENVVALATGNNKETAVTQEPVQHQAPVQQAPVQQPVPTQAPVQQVQQQAQVQQAPMQQQQPQGVPTSAPTYDMNQLAVAATQLMDAGKQQDLLNLLASFGAQSLMNLPKEQYGAFATKLRELGAKI